MPSAALIPHSYSVIFTHSTLTTERAAVRTPGRGPVHSCPVLWGWSQNGVMLHGGFDSSLRKKQRSDTSRALEARWLLASRVLKCSEENGSWGVTDGTAVQTLQAETFSVSLF